MSAFLNKVVIVTGSGSGIGKAIAAGFCKLGAGVILNGRNEEKLKRTRDEFKTLGYAAEYFVADITNYDDCKKLVAFTTKTFGTINVLVTNAGISMNARFDKMGPELFKKVLDSNVYGTTSPLFACLDILKKTKGSVIFISSLAGLYGMPTASAYSAGKMALTAIQQSIRSELHQYGVHVGILYVGFTENDAEKKLLSANGEWLPVPDRPRLLQQSQKEVADAVLQMTRYRIHKKTLSAVGFFTSVLTRFAPWIMGYASRLSEKRMKDKA